jgi:hypothetical protein
MTVEELVRFDRPVFQTTFTDAQEQISQLFFVSDFHQQAAEAPESDDGDSSGSESGEETRGVLTQVKENYLKRRLLGHLLLVETKKGERRKAFRKLHLVEIQDNLGPLYLNTDGKRKQNLSQVDQLTIAETHSKFVQYDAARGLIFMMNLERERDRHIKLFSVKLKRELADYSDSDEAQDDANSKMYRMCFEFITEVRLELDSQSFSAI